MSPKTKQFIQVILCVLLQSQSAVASVLVSTSTTSDEDFRAVVAAFPEHISYVDYLAQQEAARLKDYRIKESFLEAQKLFLNAQDKEAQTLYESITAMQNVENWPAEIRVYIINAYYRLAQLSQDSALKTKLFISALALDPEAIPPKKTFSPVFIADFNKAKKDFLENLRTIQIPTSWKSYDYLQIYGRRYDLRTNSFVQIGQWPARITLVSNALQAQSAVVDSESYAALVPQKKVLVEGSCESPHLLIPIKVVAVFSLDCLLEGTAQKFTSLEPKTSSPALDLTLTPQTFVESYPNLNFTPAPVVKNKTWLKVLAGVALASLGYMVYQKTQDKKAEAPANSQMPALQPKNIDISN